MKLTANEEYGLRCLVRLGQEGPGGRLTIPEISHAEGVSAAYAAKILRMLRQGGFVTARAVSRRLYAGAPGRARSSSAT